LAYGTAVIGSVLLVSGIALSVVFVNAPDSPFLVFAGLMILAGLAMLAVSLVSYVVGRFRPDLPPLSPPAPAAQVPQTPGASQAQTPPADGVPIVLAVGVDELGYRKKMRAILAFTVFALIFLFIVLATDYQVGLLLLAIYIVLFFVQVYSSTAALRRTAIALTLARSLSTDQGIITLPAGVRVEKVEVTTSGFYDSRYPITNSTSRRYRSLTNVSDAPIGQTLTGTVVAGKNPWGAIADSNGIGWFQATAFRVTDGPFKEVILVPIEPSEVQYNYFIMANLDDDSASAEIEAKGPMLSGHIQRSTGSRIKSYYIEMRGKSGRNNVAFRITSPKSDDFTLQAQPTVPLVLVAHRKLFNPLLIMRVLIGSNAHRGALFGGIGVGTFTAELVLNTGLIKAHVFPSEPIPY
jgi:hypothetical protein